MNKKHFFLIFQVFFIKMLSAQNSPYQLELKPDVLGKIKSPNIVIDTIVDARFNNNNWGVVMTGLSNKRTPVSIENGALGLKYYFDASITSDKSAEHIIMILKNLWINEQTVGMKEIATCDLELTLCKKDKDNQWRIIHEFEDQVEGSTALTDMTRSTPNRVKEIFEKALSSIDVAKLTGNEGEIYKEEPLMITNCIVFRKDSLKYGFYKSFNQFYNNQTQQLDIEIKKTIFSDKNYKLIDGKTGKKLKRYFGFHDGTDLYLNSASYGQVNSQYYSKVLTFGRYMLVDDSYIDPMASAVGSQFGILGAIAVMATAKRGMMLDVYTGQSIVLTEKKMKEILTPYPNLLAKYNKLSSKDDSFELRKIVIDALNKAEMEKK